MDLSCRASQRVYGCYT